MFKLTKIENGCMNVPEPLFYDSTSDEAIIEGEALVLKDGKLSKCGATERPAFVAMSGAIADGNGEVAVMYIESNQLFEVPVSDAPGELVPGKKVTLHTDGLQVTATEEAGVATIVDTLGAKAAGDKVIVRFE